MEELQVGGLPFVDGGNVQHSRLSTVRNDNEAVEISRLAALTIETAAEESLSSSRRWTSFNG